ncbi:MAG: hypothetical protein CBE36_00900 [Oceanospirillaceae bacterium TMED276]|nr:hypothetical protein [Oceanospirillaceae bacterium]OUX66987.1 MAG: hypothetical protein CBE36_00900 [Oceanospirillaceae bacterium TMED276]
MTLPDYVPLNPLSTDANTWFDLSAALMQTSILLVDEAHGWQGLGKELEHLAVQKQVHRPLSITRLTGAKELPAGDTMAQAQTLRDAALNDQELEAPESEEVFDQQMRDIPRTLTATHREWDGRLLLTSHELLPQLLPLIRYAGARQRDAMLPATVVIEGIRQEALERIRSKYWWFLMHPQSAEALVVLFRQCGFSAISSGPLGKEGKHAFFFCNKSSQGLNKVILHLMSSKRSAQLSEFGRFLSKHRHRFRTP